MPHEMISHLQSSPLTTNPQPSTNLEHNLSNQQYDTTMHEASASTLPSSSPSSSQPFVTEERAPSRASSIHDLLNPSPSEHVPQRSEALNKPPTQCSAGSSTCNPKVHITPQDKGNVSVDAANETPITSSQDVNDSPSQREKKRKRTFTDLDNSKPVVNQESTRTTTTLPIFDRQSNVRLTISLDGSVKVKTSDEETPSPPKDRDLSSSTPIGESLKSKSGAMLKELQGAKELVSGRKSSGTFGRSRDSRTWEFYCDSEARDSLAIQAERERNGSAAGAISLIRSQSQSKRNSVEGNRRTLTPKAGGGNMKRIEPTPAKPKLTRATSSRARIQGNKEIKEAHLGPGHVGMASKASSVFHRKSPSSDSDKENWVPGTRASNNTLRRGPSVNSNSLTILGESRHMNLARELDTQSNRKRIRGSDPAVILAKTDRAEGEDCDEEVVAFMNGRGNEGEDFDCVQGLLSLSQGAWR